MLVVTGVLLAGCSSSGTTDGGKTPGPGPATDSKLAADTRSSAPPETAGSATGEDATVVIGTGKTVVTIYEDFRCPQCKAFHDQIKPAMMAAQGANQLKVVFHEVDLVDRTGGGKGSLMAANAAACAFRTANFQLYRDALFAAQPAENDDSFAQPDKLISLAHDIKGLDNTSFENCVKTTPYAASIKSMYDSTLGAGKFNGVPALFINDTQWQIPTSGDVAGALTQALQAAAKS